MTRSRRQHRRSHASRDIAPRGKVSEPRSLARYRREVVALLIVGHRIKGQDALRLIKKWDRYVRARRLEGRPPCNVADHLSKFERERLVRPSSRDVQRSQRTMSRRTFLHQMRPVSRRSRRSRSSRDAEHPHKGEVFETRAGQRWEITEVTDKKVTVKRKGTRPRSEGPFVWGRSVLKSLKHPKDEPKPETSQLSLFSRGVNNDPERRRKKHRRRRQ